MPRLRAIYFAPALALIALLAWALASPIGAGPDDDFHLTSTWCASADPAACAPGDASTTRYVPEAVHEIACFAFDPDKSAACQGREFSLDPSATVLTDRGNFVGAYPPVFYSVMGVFVSPDILASALAMRVLNVVLFVGITTALFLLLPRSRRATLLLAWAITTVPLGLFLIASNNPSSWAVIGVGSLWIALLGFFETDGRRKAGLAAVAAVATIMAAGARGDAALYSVVAIGAVLVLTFTARRQFFIDAIVPVALALIAGLFFLGSRQVNAGIEGFSGGSVSGPGGTAETLSGFGLVAYNLLNVPSLIAGVFGNWGLGWLDTPMPAVVTFASVATFAAVGFIGITRLSRRKALVVVGVFVVLWLLPVYVLVQGGDMVGEGVQPRYLLPLVVLLGGLLLLTRNRGIAIARAQLIVIVAALSVANFVALHMNIRRYVTGNDEPGWNLNAGAEWWWNTAVSPMAVWIIGALAYAALLAILARSLRREPVEGNEAEPVATPSR